VTVKRTNRPGISTTNRPPRGRFRPRSNYHYGYAPRPRGRYRLESRADLTCTIHY